MTLKSARHDANSEMVFLTFRSQSDSFSIECNSHFSSLSSDCELCSHISHVYSDICINTCVNSNPYLTSYLYSNMTTSTRNKFFKCTYVHLCLSHLKLSNIQHLFYKSFLFYKMLISIGKSIEIDISFTDIIWCKQDNYCCDWMHEIYIKERQ